MGLEFKAWNKIPRLRREVTITEKIDGTNAAAVILLRAEGDYDAQLTAGELIEVGDYVVGAQSRKRLIQPGKDTDNAGFAKYVWDNAEDFVEVLGLGYHYGEWYGQGIQRGYDLDHRRFALFNTERWRHLADDGPLSVLPPPIPGLGVVPVLYKGPFHSGVTTTQRNLLSVLGSVAVPGYMRPEGFVMWHSQSRQLYKVLLEHDDVPKGLVA